MLFKRRHAPRFLGRAPPENIAPIAPLAASDALGHSGGGGATGYQNVAAAVGGARATIVVQSRHRAARYETPFTTPDAAAPRRRQKHPARQTSTARTERLLPGLSLRAPLSLLLICSATQNLCLSCSSATLCPSSLPPEPLSSRRSFLFSFFVHSSLPRTILIIPIFLPAANASFSPHFDYNFLFRTWMKVSQLISDR